MDFLTIYPEIRKYIVNMLDKVSKYSLTLVSRKLAKEVHYYNIDLFDLDTQVCVNDSISMWEWTHEIFGHGRFNKTAIIKQLVKNNCMNLFVHIFGANNSYIYTDPIYIAAVCKYDNTKFIKLVDNKFDKWINLAIKYNANKVFREISNMVDYTSRASMLMISAANTNNAEIMDIIDKKYNSLSCNICYCVYGDEIQKWCLPRHSKDIVMNQSLYLIMVDSKNMTKVMPDDIIDDLPIITNHMIELLLLQKRLAIVEKLLIRITNSGQEDHPIVFSHKLDCDALDLLNKYGIKVTTEHFNKLSPATFDWYYDHGVIELEFITYFNGSYKLYKHILKKYSFHPAVLAAKKKFIEQYGSAFI